MKKFNPMTDLGICFEDVEKINALIERDTAKAEKVEERYDLAYCPTCGKLTINSYVFCPACGQRLDHDNKAL